MAEVNKLVPIILKWEGGFVNDPLDKGGATNKGVTLATFQRVFGKNKTVEDLKKITDEQWMTILKKFYWDKWKADFIFNQSVANLLVDWVWTSGVHGIKIPQQILGVQVDGVVGQKTIDAINKSEPSALFKKIWIARRDFFNRIVERNPTQQRFIKGWLNRLNDFKYKQ